MIPIHANSSYRGDIDSLPHDITSAKACTACRMMSHSSLNLNMLTNLSFTCLPAAFMRMKRWYVARMENLLPASWQKLMMATDIALISFVVLKR